MKLAGKSLLMHAIMRTLPPPPTAKRRILLGDLGPRSRPDRPAREQLPGASSRARCRARAGALTADAGPVQQVAEVHEVRPTAHGQRGGASSERRAVG